MSSEPVGVLRFGKQALAKADFDAITARLSRAFRADCTLLSGADDVPRSAYNPRRAQYSADAIMRVLSARAKGLPVDRLLAVTNVDLYVPNLNFIFGLSECPGRLSLVSTYRLNPEYYGGRPDRRLFLERCIKECVHELGHSYGLTHCSDPHCVMRFSNSILDVDFKTSSFCDTCEGRLLKALRKAP